MRYLKLAALNAALGETMSIRTLRAEATRLTTYPPMHPDGPLPDEEIACPLVVLLGRAMDRPGDSRAKLTKNTIFILTAREAASRVAEGSTDAADIELTRKAIRMVADVEEETPFRARTTRRNRRPLAPRRAR